MMIVLSQLKKSKEENFCKTSTMTQIIVKRKILTSLKRTMIGSTMRFIRLPRVVMSLNFRLFLTRLTLLDKIFPTTCLRLSVISLHLLT